MQRVGAIDCGTNSIRLLIADIDDSGNLHDLVRKMRVVRLGEGVDATGAFAPEALDRTLAAASDYASLLQEHDVTQLRFAATSASRDVRNRDVFIEGIQRILGVTPEVITGVEEANLSFAGAVSSIGNTQEPTVVVDLGGGSTEFVIGSAAGVIAAQSLNIGCVRLTERYGVSSPVTGAQRALIAKDVAAALSTLAEDLDFSTVKRLVGVAGTVTTVTAQALALTTYDSAAINGSTLSAEAVVRAANQLATMNRQQRMATGFMHEGRVDVIGTGALIWAQIVEFLGERSQVYEVTASEHDILDGLALSLAVD